MYRILHVEDDDDIREICRISFDFAGLTDVVQCHDAFSALEVCDDHEPDLLLLDQMMPGMNGMELLAELRKKPLYQDVPAVFFSALSQESERDEMMRSGAIDIISKPFDPMTLGEKIWKFFET